METPDTRRDENGERRQGPMRFHAHRSAKIVREGQLEKVSKDMEKRSQSSIEWKQTTNKTPV